jgi:hypothetical protein
LIRRSASTPSPTSTDSNSQCASGRNSKSSRSQNTASTTSPSQNIAISTGTAAASDDKVLDRAGLLVSQWVECCGDEPAKILLAHD